MISISSKLRGFFSSLLVLASMRASAQVAPAVPADFDPSQAELAGPATIDPDLASTTIRDRTLVNIWSDEGDLAAMRRVLADASKRSHVVGHLAEEDFVARNPAWRKTAAANAPENDVWRWFRGRLEGGQIKTHVSGEPTEYFRDMFKDTKAENFFVPDNHVAPLVQKIQQQIDRAEANGNERVAAVWRRELERVKPLGRTYAELERPVLASAKATVRGYALDGAIDSGMLVLAAENVVICYRSAKGELTPLQTEQAETEAGVKAGAVGVATYGAIVLGANPVGITVIVVGGVIYVLADYAIEEVRPSYVSNPMTTAEIDKAMPIGWRREEP